jgi:replication factor C subunit 2/4
MIQLCLDRNIHQAHDLLNDLWRKGYSAQDIVQVCPAFLAPPCPADSLIGEQTLFRVSRNYEMEEKIKLEYMKVIGTAHMRILDGLDSLLQLSGLLAKLCLVQP